MGVLAGCDARRRARRMAIPCKRPATQQRARRCGQNVQLIHEQTLKEIEAMEILMHAMKKLSTAEEFLDFFAIEYQPAVVHVNRLHILQRFHQYLRQTPLAADSSDDEALHACRKLLDQAYQDFVGSSAIKERVFKVFRDAEGVKTVSVENIRAALPQRQKIA